MSDDPAIERLRRHQMKNLVVILLMSVGTPMLLMGDEMCRTQRGNNNAYCQDNEVGWLDWSLLDRNRELHRFVRSLIAHRRRLMGASIEESFELSLCELLRRAEIDWHGVRLDAPAWSNDSHSMACTLRTGPRHRPLWLHVMFNAYWEALDFDLPSAPTSAVAGWQRWIDTSRAPPDDITDIGAAPLVSAPQYRVEPRSVAVLIVQAAARSGRTFAISDAAAANSASA
jgi:isoamylase